MKRVLVWNKPLAFEPRELLDLFEEYGHNERKGEVSALEDGRVARITKTLTVQAGDEKFDINLHEELQSSH